MDPVRGRRKTARKELTHLPREDRRKTLSEKLKKNQPKRVDFPPQMAEFLLTEHTFCTMRSAYEARNTR